MSWTPPRRREPGPPIEDLVAAARARALEATAVAAELAAATRRCHERTRAVRRWLRETRLSSRPRARLFRLDGAVGGEPVAAVMRADGLMADAVLVERGRLLAAMGEVFEHVDGTVLRATVDGPPVAVMLTLIRACDRAFAFEIRPTSYRVGGAGPDGWGRLPRGVGGVGGVGV